MRRPCLLWVSGVYLVVCAVLITQGCSKDKGVVDPPPTGESYHFNQAVHIANNDYDVSVALDGTTLIEINEATPAGNYIQASAPGASGTTIIIPLEDASISPDGKHLVGVDSDTETLEIWHRTAGTNWSLQTEVYTAEDPSEITSPGFSASGLRIVGVLGPYGAGESGWEARKLVMWRMEGSLWIGPEDFRYEDGSPITDFDDPCLSPGGEHLYAIQGVGQEYRMFEFEKQASGWRGLGQADPEINLTDYHEVSNPFMAFDYSYFYFGAWDPNNDKTGIFRAKVVQDE